MIDLHFMKTELFHREKNKVSHAIRMTNCYAAKHIKMC